MKRATSLQSSTLRRKDTQSQCIVARDISIADTFRFSRHIYCINILSFNLHNIVNIFACVVFLFMIILGNNKRYHVFWKNCILSVASNISSKHTFISILQCSNCSNTDQFYKLSSLYK